MHYTLREYDWLEMKSSLLSTVRNCQNCIQLRSTYFKHQKLLELFLAAKFLEFIAMDLLGPLNEATQGSTFTMVLPVYRNEKMYQTLKYYSNYSYTAF